jgi:DNA-directed RNA polymerase specialized sigma24 family protein
MTARVSKGPDEITLLRQAADGSADAFLRLVSKYDGPILNLAVRVAGSRKGARDIYRRVLLELYRNLPSIKPSALRKWIYRLAAQACLKHLRQAPVSSVEPVCVIEPLDRAMRTITPRKRLVFELHYDRLDLDEVSKVLDTTPGAASAALACAIGRLRGALESTPDGQRCTESS